MPASISGLETFSLNAQDPRGEEDEEDREALPDIRDADSFFNLPGDDGDEDDRSRR